MKLDGVKFECAAMAILALLIGSGLSLSFSTARACTVTTTIAKPTGLTATANPSSRNENGILLQWNSAAKADKVYGYHAYRTKTPGEPCNTTAVLPFKEFGIPRPAPIPTRPVY